MAHIAFGAVLIQDARAIPMCLDAETMKKYMDKFVIGIAKETNMNINDFDFTIISNKRHHKERVRICQDMVSGYGSHCRKFPKRKWL